MIEAVTGATLGEFFKKRIFEPLGMSNTSFDIARENTDRLAPCFRFTGRIDKLQEFFCRWVLAVLLQGSAKRSADFVKQQPDRARQKS